MKMHVTNHGESRGKRRTAVTPGLFAAQLVEAAQVRPGHAVLDLFFGLGYCSLHALGGAGAASVHAFERSAAVLQLAAANPGPFPFSEAVRVVAPTLAPPPSDAHPALLLRGAFDADAWPQGLWRWAGRSLLPPPPQCAPEHAAEAVGKVLVQPLNVTKPSFWGAIRGRTFDSVIVDPPRWSPPPPVRGRNTPAPAAEGGGVRGRRGGWGQ